MATNIKLTLRTPPHTDFLRGYPGVPSYAVPSSPGPGGLAAQSGGTFHDPVCSIPILSRQQCALVGQVEVRLLVASKGQQGISARWLSVELEKIEVVPSAASGAGQQQVLSRHVELIGIGPGVLWSAAGSGGEEDWGTMEEGNYAFRIPIPEGLPPTTEVDMKGSGVSYRLVATLCSRGKKGLLKTAPKQLISTDSAPIHLLKADLLPTWPRYSPLLLPPLPTPPLPWAQQGRDDACLGEIKESRLTLRGKGREGEITMRAIREAGAYGPGDTARVRVEVGWNGAGGMKLTRLDFVLRETLTFRYPPGTPLPSKPTQRITALFTSTANISSNPPTGTSGVGFAVLYPGEPLSFDLVGTVPASHTRVTVRTAKHIDVAYHFKVRAMLEGGDEVSVDHWAAVIGNVGRREARGVMEEVGWVEGLCERGTSGPDGLISPGGRSTPGPYGRTSPGPQRALVASSPAPPPAQQVEAPVVSHDFVGAMLAPVSPKPAAQPAVQQQQSPPQPQQATMNAQAGPSGYVSPVLGSSQSSRGAFPPASPPAPVAAPIQAASKPVAAAAVPTTPPPHASNPVAPRLQSPTFGRLASGESAEREKERLYREAERTRDELQRALQSGGALASPPPAGAAAAGGSSSSAMREEDTDPARPWSMMSEKSRNFEAASVSSPVSQAQTQSRDRSSTFSSSMRPNAEQEKIRLFDAARAQRDFLQAKYYGPGDEEGGQSSQKDWSPTTPADAVGAGLASSTVINGGSSSEEPTSESTSTARHQSRLSIASPVPAASSAAPARQASTSHAAQKQRATSPPRSPSPPQLSPSSSPLPTAAEEKRRLMLAATETVRKRQEEARMELLNQTALVEQLEMEMKEWEAAETIRRAEETRREAELREQIRKEEEERARLRYEEERRRAREEIARHQRMLEDAMENARRREIEAEEDLMRQRIAREEATKERLRLQEAQASAPMPSGSSGIGSSPSGYSNGMDQQGSYFQSPQRMSLHLQTLQEHSSSPRTRHNAGRQSISSSQGTDARDFSHAGSNTRQSTTLTTPSSNVHSVGYQNGAFAPVQEYPQTRQPFPAGATASPPAPHQVKQHFSVPQQSQPASPDPQMFYPESSIEANPVHQQPLQAAPQPSPQPQPQQMYAPQPHHVQQNSEMLQASNSEIGHHAANSSPATSPPPVPPLPKSYGETSNGFAPQATVNGPQFQHPQQQPTTYRPGATLERTMSTASSTFAPSMSLNGATASFYSGVIAGGNTGGKATMSEEKLAYLRAIRQHDEQRRAAGMSPGPASQMRASMAAVQHGRQGSSSSTPAQPSIRTEVASSPQQPSPEEPNAQIVHAMSVPAPASNRISFVATGTSTADLDAAYAAKGQREAQRIAEDAARHQVREEVDGGEEGDVDLPSYGGAPGAAPHHLPPLPSANEEKAQLQRYQAAMSATKHYWNQRGSSSPPQSPSEAPMSPQTMMSPVSDFTIEQTQPLFASTNRAALGRSNGSSGQHNLNGSSGHNASANDDTASITRRESEGGSVDMHRDMSVRMGKRRQQSVFSDRDDQSAPSSSVVDFDFGETPRHAAELGLGSMNSMMRRTYDGVDGPSGYGYQQGPSH